VDFKYRVVIDCDLHKTDSYRVALILDEGDKKYAATDIAFTEVFPGEAWFFFEENMPFSWKQSSERNCLDYLLAQPLAFGDMKGKNGGACMRKRANIHDRSLCIEFGRIRYATPRSPYTDKSPA